MRWRQRRDLSVRLWLCRRSLHCCVRGVSFFEHEDRLHGGDKHFRLRGQQAVVETSLSIYDRLEYGGIRDERDKLVFAQQQEISSWHLLFPPATESQLLLEHGMHQRQAVQFHWFNDNYGSFDEFLAGFSSRKRKSLKRERRRIEEQGLVLERLVGDQISSEHWDFFHRCYQFTYAKRSGHGGYLTREFFTEVAAAMGEQVILVLARDGEAPVAGALYFRSGDTLFGRYWGCLREYDCLHFEACYYQGIEFCIEHGIGRFDPGAQGEHKIQRGFRPVQTYSNHWIADPRLSAAVEDFTHRERPGTEAYLEEAATLLPFKQVN